MENLSQVSPADVISPVPSSTAPAPFDFLDLKAQFATIRGEVMEAITRVMESQHFILGDEVRLFEEETAAMLGAKHAIACASGTDSLILALLAAGIGPGDEVITTPFSFIATAGTIALVGAKPVFVDIDAATFNIDPEKIEAVITPKTKALMPVHLFGLPAEMFTILQIAKDRNLAVIEDAAQAIGSKYGDRHIGTLGTFGCFSFFPSKNLGGAGDGGLVTTEDPKLADRLRLDALQAAILRVKLRHLKDWTLGRQNRADRYRALLEASGLTSVIQVPQAPPAHFRHVYNQFSVRCQDRDRLRDFLRLAGIPTEIYYPLPLHLQPAFAALGYQAGQFGITEKACSEVLALPVYPELKDSQQDSVVRSIAEFYSNKN
jgi:dTDP-4-amino-4,6-dideoxygalactose transaminase